MQNKLKDRFTSNSLNNELNFGIVSTGTADHKKLQNLDYENSGHTGFASSKDVNKINQELSKCIKDENYVHTDNNFTTEEKNKLANLKNFSGNASDIDYKDNVGYGVDNVQDALDEAFNSLDSKAEVGDFDNYVSYNKQNKNDTQKATARKNISAKKDIIDLGEIDLADYDDDFDTFMNTLLNEGQYKFFNDAFTYYVEVINLGNAIGQEYCGSEEGYAVRYFRTIYFDDTGIFDYATDWDSFMTFAIANSAYAPKNHAHYKVLNTASTIRTYLDTFNQYGEFSITSTADKEKYWVFTDYYNVTVNGKTENRRIQRYYSMSEPWKIYSRFGLYNNTTRLITWDNWYINTYTDKENGGNNLLSEETITIDSGSTTVPVTGIELDYTAIELEIGQSMQIACSVLPDNATNNAVIWSSSDSTKVKVKEGYVTALASGVANITAKSVENTAITATCVVTVKSSGGDTPAGGKIYLYDLTPVKDGAAINKNLKTEFSNPSAKYYQIPYSKGMYIVTGLLEGWIKNYPPIIVDDGGTITVPETTVTDGFIYGVSKGYSSTLTGFSQSAKVYVNTYALTSTTKEYVYYIAGGNE